MPLVKCPDCGNVISPSAPTCPHCGRPQSPVTAEEPGTPTAGVKKKVSPAVVAVAIGAIVWLFFYAANRSPDDAPSSTLNVERGPKQDKFCDVVQSFIRDYREAEKSGANEAGLSQLRYNRKQSLSAIMNAGEVAGWTGAVKRVTTDRDGTGRLAVQLSCGSELRSDVELYSKQGIAQGTALYATLISLTPGSKIIIAGTFEITRNGTDYIGERSLTEAGSMTNPEFNFAFESFSPAMDQDSSTASASAPAEPATLAGAPELAAIRDMIRQQNMKCESVVGVKTAETGEDVVTCQNQGDQVVYKILAGANGPVIATIDYHSGVASPTAEASSVLGTGTASKRLPLPHDTKTDCMGPFYEIPERAIMGSAWCQSEIATAHVALRKEQLPCDAIVMEWRDEPFQSSMMKLECFVADDSTYGSSAVAYEIGGTTSQHFKRVSEEQWRHDLMCARGVHIPPGSPEYAEIAASCSRDPQTVDPRGITNSAQAQTEKQAFVQAPMHSAPDSDNTSFVTPTPPSSEYQVPSDPMMHKVDEHRRETLISVLRVRHKPCDDLIQVAKDGSGAFEVTCKVSDRTVLYTESVDGLN